jgi:hypothetical protein
MTADDDDGGAGEDVFVRSGTTTRLVTAGIADDEQTYIDVMSASADGRSLIMESDRPLAAGDADVFYDVYEWSDGTIRQLASGTGTGDTTFMAAASDHRTAFLWSLDALDEADADEAWDVYAVRTPAHEQQQQQQQEPRQEQPARDDRDGTTPGPNGSDRDETPAGDRTPPAVTVSGSQSQRVVRGKGIRVTVRADEAATATLRARVKAGARSIVTRLATRALAAGRPSSILLKLAPRDLARLKRELRPGRSVTATISLSVTDAAGNATAKSLKVTLRR